MNKKNRDLLTAFIDAAAMYLALHPHAVEDAKRKFWYYTAHYSSVINIYAGKQYRNMNP